MITGPSEGGIGAETALCLASAGPKEIILLSRNKSRVQPVIDVIQTKYPSGSVTFVQCDLSSQGSVRKAASEIINMVPHIDVLINNAAIPPGPYSKTEDGIETQFGTNHIGHFLLTNLLLPKILSAKPGARIVNVSSSAHRYATHLFEDYNFSDGATYSEKEGYIQSKAANVLFTISLAGELEAHGIQSFSLHPGGIATGLSAAVSKEAMEDHVKKRMEQAAREGKVYTRPKKKTTQQGCSTTLVAALDPSIAGQSGAYLEDCVITERPLSALVTDMNNAEELWKLSEELVGQRFDWI